MIQQGGVTIPIYHCVINGHESITSWEQDYDPAMYATLPNLYAVCVADNSTKPRKVIGGFFAKTSHHHNDPDFETTMFGLLPHMPNLAPILPQNFSLLPARIGLEGPPITEDEMTRIMFQQVVKHSAAGTA